MRRTYAQFYVHVVWSTAGRAPLLWPEVRPKIHSFLAQRCGYTSSECIAVGGVADHVHVLAGLPPSLSPSQFVKDLKGASSYAMNRSFGSTGFRWQSGFGVFSVSPLRISEVASYVLEQERHHATGTALAEWEEIPSEQHRAVTR